MALAAWSLGLVPWFVKAWSLELLAIDPDPRSILGPTITHDLQLSRDGQELWSRGILNFYCKLFHTFLFLAKCILVIAEAITCWGLDPRSYGVGN